MSARSTRKAKTSGDGMRPEYRREDLGRGVRGRFHQQFKAGSNLVLLSPDVAKAFPDADSVNNALRSLVRIAERAKA